MAKKKKRARSDQPRVTSRDYEYVTFGDLLTIPVAPPTPAPPKPLPSLERHPPARPMPGMLAVVPIDRPGNDPYDTGIIVAMPPEFYWAPDYGLVEGMTVFYGRGAYGTPFANIDGYLYVPMQLVFASHPAPAG